MRSLLGKNTSAHVAPPPTTFFISSFCLSGKVMPKLPAGEEMKYSPYLSLRVFFWPASIMCGVVPVLSWCPQRFDVTKVQLWVQSHQFLSPTLTRFPWQHNKHLWPQEIPDSKWLIRVTVTVWWLLIYLSASISLFLNVPFLFLFFPLLSASCRVLVA